MVYHGITMVISLCLESETGSTLIQFRFASGLVFPHCLESETGSVSIQFRFANGLVSPCCIPWYLYYGNTMAYTLKKVLLAPARIEPMISGMLARRLADCATSHHGDSAAKSRTHLTARTSVHLNQLKSLMCHYQRVQLATERLSVEMVVIIGPISSA